MTDPNKLQWPEETNLSSNPSEEDISKAADGREKSIENQKTVADSREEGRGQVDKLKDKLNSTSLELFPNWRFNSLWSANIEEIKKIDIRSIENFVNKRRLDCLEDLIKFSSMIKDIDSKKNWNLSAHEKILNQYKIIYKKYSDVFGIPWDIPSLKIFLEDVRQWKFDEVSTDLSRTHEIIYDNRYVQRMKRKRKEEYDILTKRKSFDVSDPNWKLKIQTYQIPVCGSFLMGPGSNVFRMKDIKEYIQYHKRFLLDEITYIKGLLWKNTESTKDKLYNFSKSRKLFIEIIFAFKILLETAKNYKDQENETLIKDYLQDLFLWLKKLDDVGYLFSNNKSRIE
jgi:hypothetical protein